MIEIMKLVEYNKYLRHTYLETLEKIPWEEVVKDRGASFGSLRNIFLHCVTVLDWIVNNVIQGNPTYPRIKTDDYDSFEKMGEYLEHVESKTNAYLDKITEKELSRKIERKQRDGSIMAATVEDYLIHLFQEETHHRGELIGLLWQMDVSPPHVGWVQFLNK